jgi:hypothetical protein
MNGRIHTNRDHFGRSDFLSSINEQMGPSRQPDINKRLEEHTPIHRTELD